MIQLEKVSVELDERKVLKSLHLNWNQGESIGLVGANGAGKSTLLKLIATFLKPSTGVLHLPEGMDLRRWRSSIGTVFPDNYLYEPLTAYENLQFYKQLYGVEDKGSIERVLGKVDLLQVKDEQVHSFSKGMKQRLSIARALIHSPTYYLLDEPFDGLDLTSKRVIKQLLFDLKKDGVQWILVSHDLEEAWRMCDRVIALHNGKIVLDMSCRQETLAEFEAKYVSLIKEKDHAFS